HEEPRADEPVPSTTYDADDSGDAKRREEHDTGHAGEARHRPVAIVEGESGRQEDQLDVVENCPRLRIQVLIPRDTELESDGPRPGAAGNERDQPNTRRGERTIEPDAPAAERFAPRGETKRAVIQQYGERRR